MKRTMPPPHSARARGSQAQLSYRLFLRESLRNIRVTASVMPSSRFLTTAMLHQVNFRKVRNVVELGSGTGVITQEILRRMTPDSRLFALEINRSFVGHLRTSCRDSRLMVLHVDACDLLHQLAVHNAGTIDVVISSLGLTAMTWEHRERIVRQAEACLAPAGIMMQFQYMTSLAPFPKLSNWPLGRFQEVEFLRGYFPSVTARPVFFNFPPALVFTCHK